MRSGGYRGPVQSADPFHRSPEAATRDMVDLVTRRIPGSCGASSETWIDGRVNARVCSHPDLGQLMATEQHLPDSPMRMSVRTLRPVRIEDTAADLRWRPFSARALEIGVRSLLSVAHRVGEDETMTCTVYSLRPRGMPESAAALATGLLLEWTATLAKASAFADVQAEAHHLSEAIAARELVEQAKGMLMHALNCDADSAYRELTEAAERGRLRITDVARRLVEHRSAVPGPNPRQSGARQRAVRAPRT